MTDSFYEDRRKKINTLLHHLMAMVGGFMAGYTILTHCNILGNAQTANLVELVMAVLGGSPIEVLHRMGALFMYFLACMSYVFLKKKTKADIQALAILFDAAAVLLMAVMPENMPPVPALYPVFFAMPFQWNAFPGEYGYASSTIFSSNNTRQVSLSIAEYMVDKDLKWLKKAEFFMGSLLFFHAGVALSRVSVRMAGKSGVLFVLAILLGAAGVMVRREYKRIVKRVYIWKYQRKSKGRFAEHPESKTAVHNSRI